MHVALDAFLDRVEIIQGTVTMLDRLVEFGREPSKDLRRGASELHSFVRSMRESGLQPVLDGSVLLLSAAFEQFVADVMVAYAEKLPSIYRSYSDLPNAVQSANSRYTGEALSNRDSGFDPLQKQRFVENLQGCLSGDRPYSLNGSAIAFNRRNLTAERLRELMGRLGIRNIWSVIAYTRALREWSPQDSADSARQRAQVHLNDLTKDRNQIAHAVGNAVPGLGVVHAYLRFGRAIAKGLVESLEVIYGWRDAAETYSALYRRRTPGPSR